jgi:hypothetical protein
VAGRDGEVTRWRRGGLRDGKDIAVSSNRSVLGGHGCCSSALQEGSAVTGLWRERTAATTARAAAMYCDLLVMRMRLSEEAASLSEISAVCCAAPPQSQTQLFKAAM